MKKSLFLVSLLLVSFFSAAAAAEPSGDISDYQKKLSENRERQTELQKKIDSVREKERSFQNQIAYMDNQIALTGLKIDEARAKIGEKEREIIGLGEDIGKLLERIGRIETSVKFQEEVLRSRLRARYISSRVSSFDIVFGANSLNEALTRMKYLQVMAKQDQKLILQMGQTQTSYQNQKELLEKTKLRVESLKNELEREKSGLEARLADLDFQKQAKQELLAKTKGEEGEYQKQLSEIQSEQRAIEQALASFMSQLIEKGVPAGSPVKKGDVIGVQGTTGLSTGDHVHFGVYVKCGEMSTSRCPTDPRPYLDLGELSWPLSTYEVSQWYGQTPFALSSGFYADNFHNGIDLYGPFASEVRAAADGTVSYTVDRYGGRGALVYHNENLMTIYWHIK